MHPLPRALPLHRSTRLFSIQLPNRAQTRVLTTMIVSQVGLDIRVRFSAVQMPGSVAAARRSTGFRR
ncbi:hypothetical protein [Pseudorhodoferax sp.]|uniref:hypothetical protein n=1 Tax=Pseudorhodoferax sp. TaxID=1993553 RepID=UPI0039E5B8D1